MISWNGSILLARAATTESKSSTTGLTSFFLSEKEREGESVHLQATLGGGKGGRGGGGAGPLIGANGGGVTDDGFALFFFSNLLLHGITGDRGEDHGRTEGGEGEGLIQRGGLSSSSPLPPLPLPGFWFDNDVFLFLWLGIGGEAGTRVARTDALTDL